ncbi:MAG TPA: BatA domain-containing protein [Anditalea sp.]|nr:BatA domain-containing protein [Anditalea sp.]
MEFLQPLLLWGAAAITIPILIHLWHRRKGKKIQWAAMRWLTDKEDQPKKGFKPDHLLLLFLRMLIILIVVFFLSQPYLQNLSEDVITENIHFVEPNRALVNEYRFELEQAISGSEKLYWMDSELSPITSLDEVSQIESGKDKALMEALTQLIQPHHELHLYLSPHSTYMEPPFYLTPVQPVLHLGEYTDIPDSDKYMAVGDSHYLFVNQDSELETSQTFPENKKAINRTRPVTYSIGLENQEEINNIISGLKAIEEVYRLTFEELDIDADLNFVSDIPEELPLEQLFIISNNIRHSEKRNVFIEPEPFTKDQSDIVASGRLPEYILEKVLTHLELTTNTRKVSRQQLEQQFKVEETERQDRRGNLNEWIISLLLITVILERILALRKGM